MTPIEKRLRDLEQIRGSQVPFLVYVPAGVPTPEQQVEIDRAKLDRRPVFLVNESDSEL